MGGMVNPIGFRLIRNRNWKKGVSVPQVVQVLNPSGLIVDPWGTEFSFPFGKRVEFVPVHSLVFQQLIRRCYRRRFYPFKNRRLRKIGNNRRLPSTIGRGNSDKVVFSRGRNPRRGLGRFYFLWIRACTIRFFSLFVSKSLNKNFIRLIQTTRNVVSLDLFGQSTVEQLHRGFSVYRLMNRFLYQLRRHRYFSKYKLVGLLLVGRGRFTRVQRATIARLNFGRVPLSSMSKVVDKFSWTVNLKYGSSTVSFWFSWVGKKRGGCLLVDFQKG